MTMVINIDTRTSPQGNPAPPQAHAREQGHYRIPTQTLERTNVDAILRQINKAEVIEFKCVGNRPDRDSGQWTKRFRTTPSSQELELDIASSLYLFVTNSSHTFTRDILVSYFSTAIEVQRDILQEPQKPGTRSHRIVEMEKKFREFSELPENWDTYGGTLISPEAIDEARHILTTGMDLNLPDPWVAPGGDAGVGIQWDTDRAELYIDIVPKEETTYVLTPKTGNLHEADGVLTSANLSKVLNQFAEFPA